VHFGLKNASGKSNFKYYSRKFTDKFDTFISIGNKSLFSHTKGCQVQGPLDTPLTIDESASVNKMPSTESYLAA